MDIHSCLNYCSRFLLIWKTYILVVICAVVIIHIILNKIKENLELPPGPWGVPFLGRLPWTRGGAQHSQLVQLSNDYGDYFSIRLGSRLLVCIGSRQLLTDFFNNYNFTARPDTPLNNILGGYGLILSHGNLWKSQRAFIMENFRHLGIKYKFDPESRTANFIMTEVQFLLKTLEQRKGRNVDPVMLFGLHVHNVICQVMMSFRFPGENAQFKLFNKHVTEGMRLYGEVHIGEYIPAYLRLPGKRAVMDAIGRNLQHVTAFHEARVLERMSVRPFRTDDGPPPADLLDFYLDEIKETQQGYGHNIFHNVDEMKQLLQVMNDLFSAGMETVRSTLCWLLAMMVRMPHIAERVHQELASATGGPGNLVTLQHRGVLPYTEAVILETLRRVTVVPLGTTHSNTKDMIVRGRKIPAGSLVIPLLSKIHMNPEAFPDPEKFIPERFLNRGGDYPKHFIPFSVGKRACPGDNLAKMELLLFFGNIMNNYYVMLPEGDPMPSLEGQYGATHAPNPFRVCFRKRRQGRGR